MKVQNQKTLNYKDEIQKENFTGRKTENDLYYRGKILLTLKNIIILIIDSILLCCGPFSLVHFIFLKTLTFHE